jgi:hypothetical protein
MNQECLSLYEKYIKDARSIGPHNMEAFARCCYLLFAVDVCQTCASTISTYYGKMKEFYDRQAAKAASSVVNTSLTTSSTPTFTTVVMPKPVEKRGRPRK